MICILLRSRNNALGWVSNLLWQCDFCFHKMQAKDWLPKRPVFLLTGGLTT